MKIAIPGPYGYILVESDQYSSGEVESDPYKDKAATPDELQAAFKENVAEIKKNPDLYIYDSLKGVPIDIAAAVVAGQMTGLERNEDFREAVISQLGVPRDQAETYVNVNNGVNDLRGAQRTAAHRASNIGALTAIGAMVTGGMALTGAMSAASAGAYYASELGTAGLSGASLSEATAGTSLFDMAYDGIKNLVTNTTDTISEWWNKAFSAADPGMQDLIQNSLQPQGTEPLRYASSAPMTDAPTLEVTGSPEIPGLNVQNTFDMGTNSSLFPSGTTAAPASGSMDFSNSLTKYAPPWETAPTNPLGNLYAPTTSTTAAGSGGGLIGSDWLGTANQFIKDYPGVAMAGLSAVSGLGKSVLDANTLEKRIAADERMLATKIGADKEALATKIQADKDLLRQQLDQQIELLAKRRSDLSAGIMGIDRSVFKSGPPTVTRPDGSPVFPTLARTGLIGTGV